MTPPSKPDRSEIMAAVFKRLTEMPEDEFRKELALAGGGGVAAILRDAWKDHANPPASQGDFNAAERYLIDHVSPRDYTFLLPSTLTRNIHEAFKAGARHGRIAERERILAVVVDHPEVGHKTAVEIREKILNPESRAE